MGFNSGFKGLIILSFDTIQPKPLASNVKRTVNWWTC